MNSAVLIVDDEPLVRETLAEMLSGIGLDVLEAADSSEAWEVLEKRAHQVSPDVNDRLGRKADIGRIGIFEHAVEGGACVAAPRRREPHKTGLKLEVGRSERTAVATRRMRSFVASIIMIGRDCPAP